MAGMKCYYGNSVSKYADRQLDLVGIGRLLGFDPMPEVNSLAFVRYHREFATSNETHDIAQRHTGLTLFADTAHHPTIVG